MKETPKNIEECAGYVWDALAGVYVGMGAVNTPTVSRPRVRACVGRTHTGVTGAADDTIVPTPV